MDITKSRNLLCLVCFKPKSFLRDNEVPEEVKREFACGVRINMRMIEHHEWMWCANCKYFTHLPTIIRLLENYEELAERSRRDDRTIVRNA